MPPLTLQAYLFPRSTKDAWKISTVPKAEVTLFEEFRRERLVLRCHEQPREKTTALKWQTRTEADAVAVDELARRSN